MRNRKECPVCGSFLVESALVLSYKTPGRHYACSSGHLDCECRDCGSTWCLPLTEKAVYELRRVSGLGP